MLEKSNIELVIVCLPPSMHCDVTVRALEAGKHVLVEKPLATTLNEAIKIAKTSAKTNRKVCTVQNYRYLPAAKEAKKKICDGSIGKILCINTVAHSPLPPVPRSKAWLLDEGGVLDEAGPHPIDTTNWMISTNPSTVYCIRGALPNISCLTDIRIITRYEDDAVSTIGLSWLAGASKFELSIMGTAGELILGVGLNQLTERHGRTTPYHQLRDAMKLTKGNLRNVMNGSLIAGPYAYHRLILRDFVASIVHDQLPPTPLTESLRNMMISDGAKNSLAKGREINFNEYSSIDEIRKILSASETS
jgi:predicted dehydrogenase